ncbi:MAG: RIP metalloprotease RseP [Bacteroidales bacterium]|nr:RIP metalloprotease RseP [Bacteroidales bacterium]
MTVLIKILQVVLALSVLIVLHELGHFTFAKLFGIRVDKFFLFFDAGGKKLFSSKSRAFTRIFPKAARSETEYGIGWLPLGGYCKIAGMIDESMDLDTLKGEPQPWEFRSHPAWQRLLVMAGGVLFNFIGAVLIYCLIMGIWGRAYVPNENAQIYPSPLAVEMGFRSGDHILSMDGYEPENFGMLQADLVRRDVRSVRVLRGSDTVSLYIDHSMTGRVLQEGEMFALAIPFAVDSVDALSPNAGAGLSRGDRIIRLDGSEVNFLQEARPVLEGLAGSETEAWILRNGDTLALPLQVDSAGRLGIYMPPPEIRRQKFGFFEAIGEGFALTGETIHGYLQDMRLVATPSTGAYKSVGSFIAIGQVFPDRWDWYQFMYLLALLSIMLGVMNLLPIPALDGGHIVFTLYELLTGRKPSDRFLAVAQMIGMGLLLLLMMLAFGNDIGRLFK